MTGLGTGCSVAAQGPLVTVCGVWGLSNAAGQTTVPSPNLWPDARVLEWTHFASGFQLQMAATQIITVVTAGPDLTLGTDLANSARGPIAVAKYTQAGTLLTNWLPNTTGFIETYGAIFQAAVAGMLALYPTARIQPVHWGIMGEQDAETFASPNPVVYAANQVTINNYLATLTAPAPKFLLSLINVALGTMPAPFLGTTNIRTAQNSVPGVSIVNNDAIVPYDIANSNPHYSSDQCQLIGANGFALL
jgi:hypothetical protein